MKREKKCETSAGSQDMLELNLKNVQLRKNGPFKGTLVDYIL